ncbi:MAG: class I SAM-dependent methyltransferase [Bacteroidetes bacterium]|nr:class I SAM-dependent methyltransferase [Bacteroidota bacterium]
MNERKHWDNIGERYNDEIFDVFASDRLGLLPKYFRKHGSKRSAAFDFGCGNGKAFRFLSPLFREVIGADISENLLVQAGRRGFRNVQVHQADLTKPARKTWKADFVFSCNVIMLPELEANYKMLKNVSGILNKGGSAVIVVPAAESIMYSGWRLIDWYKREGIKAEKIDSDDLSYFKGTRPEIVQGLFYIDGVPTKHFSAVEIEVIFKDAGLKVTALEKLEYGWDTEFAEPPTWMKAPYPWDWLIECRKA